jgi:hypothetical protein
MDRIAEGEIARLRAPILRWSAVFAGAFFALGVWVLLWVLGLAVGLSSVDMNNPASVASWTGIWTLIAPLIALFVGGLVAGRVSGPVDRVTGILHGAVMWGLTTVAGVLVVGSLIGALAGGIAKAGGAAAQGVGGTGAFLSADDLLGPVNSKLRAEGKPAVTAEQVGRAIKSMQSTAAAGGTLDRNTFSRALSQNTNLSRQDALDIADQFQGQLGAAKQGLEQGAVKVARVSGKAFWGVFIALALGLLTSVLGSAAGVSRKRVETTA